MAAEKTFENKIKKYLKDQGCWHLKTWSNGVQRSGVPDILACVNGYFLGIEVKAPNGKPSELQKYEIREIRNACGSAVVLYPDQFEQFTKLIELLKNHNTNEALQIVETINERSFLCKVHKKI